MKSQFKKSVTLIELMVTVSILAIGIVGVVRALIVVAGAINYAENKILAARLLDSKVLELYELSLGDKEVFEADLGGQIELVDKDFKWQAGISSFIRDEIEHKELKEINLKVSWQEANKQKDESSVFYLFLKN